MKTKKQKEIEDKEREIKEWETFNTDGDPINSNLINKLKNDVVHLRLDPPKIDRNV